MSDLPQQDTINQYLAGGSQTNFVVNYYVPLETDDTPDLDVYVTPAGQPAIPATDLQVWSVNYVYVPNVDPTSGGVVQFLSGSIPANGDVVTLVRDVQASLNVDFSDAQTFSGANLDNALNRLLLIEQQNKTYALQRNLSYIVNSYLPESTLQSNVQIPVLANQQIWMGSAGGVIAATLEQNPDVSTLRSELANDQPGTDGARIVGYYDTILNAPTTVDGMLTDLNTELTSLTTEVNSLITEVGTKFDFIGRQILTGTGTYTKTAGTKWIWARAVGGGGGGGGVTANASQVGIASGGGAGAYGEAWVDMTALTTITYSVGAAGAAGAISAAGGAGGSTTFGSAGSILNLGGGVGGARNNNVSSAIFIGGSAGGAVTTAQFGSKGEDSHYGVCLNSSAGASGKGADSKFGSGGIAHVNTSSNGSAATGYGAGGSGGFANGSDSRTGGAGAPGTIVVFEFGVSP